MKTRRSCDLATMPVSLRSACDISRACRPTWAVAHLPLQLGAGHQRRHRVDDDDVDRVRSAPASRRSPAPARRCRAGRPAGRRCRRRACAAYSASSACSASMKAATPPLLLRLARRAAPAWSCRERLRAVDLHDPAAREAADAEGRSTAMEPVEIAGTSRRIPLPRRMIEPLPNWRSIWVSALSTALSLSLRESAMPAPLLFQGRWTVILLERKPGAESLSRPRPLGYTARRDGPAVDRHPRLQRASHRRRTAAAGGGGAAARRSRAGDRGGRRRLARRHPRAAPRAVRRRRPRPLPARRARRQPRQGGGDPQRASPPPPATSC